MRNRTIVSKWLAMAAASVVSFSAAGADFNFSAPGTSGTPALWGTAANWTPASVPGAADKGIFGRYNGITAGSFIDLQSNRSLTTAEFNTQWVYTLGNLSTTNTLSVGTINVSTEGYIDPISFDAWTNDKYHRINAPITGSGGLVKTGPGTIILGGTNTFTGGFVINGGRVHTLAGDGAFGGVGQLVTLNGGTIRTTGTMTSSRTWQLGAGGGTFQAESSNTTLSGSIIGTGGLTKTGFQSLNLTGSSSFGGLLTVAESSFVNLGTVSTATGRLTGTTGLDLTGRLSIFSVDVDRIPDTARVTLRGGLFQMGMVANVTETVGAFSVVGGFNRILLTNASGTTGQQLTIGNLTRQQGGLLLVVGGGLGQSAADRQVAFSAGAGLPVGALIGGAVAAGTTTQGIVPWVLGQNPTQASGASGTLTTVGNSFVTSDAFGLRPLNLATEYRQNDINGAGATENVRMLVGQTLTGNRTINSLNLQGSASGTTYTIDGTGTLSITSGALAFTIDPGATGVVTGKGGGTVTIGSGVGIDFGTREGIIYSAKTTNGLLRINGAIAGSGGLTLASSANDFLTLAGTSSVTGTVRIVQGNISAQGAVLANVAGPFGNSNDAVILQPGGESNNTISLSLGLTTGTGTAVLSRPLIVNTSPYGNSAAAFVGPGNALDTLQLNGPITLNGPLSVAGSGTIGSLSIKINGVITGTGKLLTNSGQPGDTLVTSSNPGWSGGVELFGNLAVDSNTALGTGTVMAVEVNDFFLGIVTPKISSYTVARTLANPFEVVGGIQFGEGFPFDPNFALSDLPLTLTGPMRLLGATAVLNVQNTQTTVGNLVDGNVSKKGPGVLRLNGSGSTMGLLSVTEGLALVTAGGSSLHAVDVTSGAALHVSSTGPVSSYQYTIRGTGISSDGAIRNLAGNNTLSGRLLLATDSSVGADAGTTLRFSGDTAPASGTLSGLTLTKLGAGVLATAKVTNLAVNVTAGTVQLSDSDIGNIEGDVFGLGFNGGNGGTIGAGSTSVLNSLTLAGPTSSPTSSLDVRNNDVVIRSGATIDAIREQISYAYNGGLWDRPGITSSRASADGLAVGFSANSDTGYAVFSGVAVTTGDFLVKYTWFGDANLDGQVDGDDYLLWLAVFGSSGTGIGWQQGDFDYDQEVDGDDYLLWLQNFGNGVGSPLSAVPEPGVMGLAAMAGAGLLARRRRGLRA